MSQESSSAMAVEILDPNLQPSNGIYTNGIDEPTVEELERELPMVYDGQVPLGDLLSRVSQSIYAELSELAETMPNMSDSARKRTLADWVVKTKKQVVKLYAAAKWARDADAVQKCMNITAFLMNQNRQFEDAIVGLNYARESLDPARLRNHDLLTSLDVLTTGSYRRLPSAIKKFIVPTTPLSDAEVVKTLTDMQDSIRYRLRLMEIIPVEMSRYVIANGRVTFTVPKLFETSICLRGAQKDDGWFFVQVEFLIHIGGDMTGTQDFPRKPTYALKRHITDEADARLAFYLPLPEDLVPPPGVDIPPRPQLPEGTVDAPLIRLFNFLQIMSLSYQLEILWYQAERMRSLGWANYMTVNMSPNRKKMTVSYWIRPPPPTIPGRQRPKIALLGGTLTIEMVEARASTQAGGGPVRTPKARVLADLQQKSKLGGMRPSDEVEGFKFEVRWEPAKGAFGIMLPQEESVLPKGYLFVDADNLDFEGLLTKVLDKHAKAILSAFKFQLQHGITRSVFSAPGVVSLVSEADVQALRVHLCADEVVIITIDSRTGRLNLRDTGDLAAAGRGPRFSAISEKLNENPTMLLEALVRLRLNTITDMAEQKASYLGLQSFRRRNFSQEEMVKLGPSARGTLYIQLANFPAHYLVIVITDDEFRYALITAKVLSDSMYANMVMEDIAWLDFGRIQGEELIITSRSDPTESAAGMKRKRADDALPDLQTGDSARVGFDLETQVLRELYSYCCARVAYMNVERQFKLRNIPFTHVNPTSEAPITNELAHIQSSLARSVPALCVQSKHILSGAPAAEAAMPNIRVIPLNWWSEKNAQVVTCVKLKYVQQPMGKTAGSTVIRPSKRIIYDTTEAVVSFLSENVNTCVDEFLEEWARVSKMVVIAREVAQMSKEKNWHDIRLLSFDLQTVEFAYAADYTVSLSCEDQLSPTGGSFDLRFSRCRPWPPPLTTGDQDHDMDQDDFNPHDDAEPFLRNILRHGHGRLAPSLYRLVTLLRDTLPIVTILEEIRRSGDLGKDGMPPVDTFAKSAGWYRLLYGDLRHALDFRLMSGQRVAILDGSHSLFNTGLPGSSDQVQADIKPPVQEMGLQPIPNFRETVLQAVRESIASNSVSPRRIAPIDVGVVCDADAVRVLGKAIHLKVAAALKG